MLKTFNTLALVVWSATSYANGVTLGVGKMLNNTNVEVPGVVYSAHAHATIAGPLYADVGYTMLGQSFLAEDAGITTLGIGYSYKSIRLSAAAIAGASYSPVVWYDRDRPDYGLCYREHCGIKYPNNGTIFSRHCDWCGTVVAIDYAINRRLGLRAEYYGLVGIEPTFQGVVIQLAFTIGTY